MEETTIEDIITNALIQKHECRLFATLNTFICIIIVLVNFAVVLSSGCLVKRGQEPRATYIFLGNICLADMIAGIVSVFMVHYPHQFSYGISCGVSVALAGTAGLASSFYIGLVAIDRYLYIMHGLHYHRYFTTRHPYMMALLVWLISAVPGCGPSIIFLDYYYSMEEVNCWFLILIPPKIMLIPVVMAMIPMILIMILYSIILKSALNSRSRLNRSTQSSFQNHKGGVRIFRGSEQFTSNCADEDLPSRVRKISLPCYRWSRLEITPGLCDESKWKALKIVAYTTGAYFISWFPYFVITICYAFCDFKLNFDYCQNLFVLMRQPFWFLHLANILLNPFIYAWWHPGFRVSVKKMHSKLLIKILRKQSVSSSKIHKINSIRVNGHDNFDGQI